MFRVDSILYCGWVGFKSPQPLADVSDSNIYIALQVILNNIFVLKPHKGDHRFKICWLMNTLVH